MVVVLATPPFWLANAMTLALPFTGELLLDSGKPISGLFAQRMRDSCMESIDAVTDTRALDRRMRAARQLAHSWRSALQGKRVVVCLGAGGVGKTTTSAALALRAGRARAEGRGRDDRPRAQAGRRARARRALGRAAPDRPRSCWPRRGSDEPGELWAMALDVKRTFDDVDRAPGARRGDARGDPRKPRLPGALLGRGRRAGARRGDEAVRALRRNTTST